MNKFIAGVALLALLFGGLAYFDGPIDGKDGQDGLAGQPGPDVYNHMNFHNGVQWGGTALATSSTAAAYTLLPAELDQDVYYVNWNAGLDLALTLTASTSSAFLDIPNTGDTREYLFYSATTTAATTITWTAGTGIDLLEPEINGTVVQNGGDLARVSYIRKADTDIAVVVEIFQLGD